MVFTIDIKTGWGDEDWILDVDFTVNDGEIDRLGQESAITEVVIAWCTNNGHQYIDWEYSSDEELTLEDIVEHWNSLVPESRFDELGIFPGAIFPIEVDYVNYGRGDNPIFYGTEIEVIEQMLGALRFIYRDRDIDNDKRLYDYSQV